MNDLTMLQCLCNEVTFESTYTIPNPPPPPPLRQTTNDRGVFEQTTVPGCAQTTLAALAK